MKHRMTSLRASWAGAQTAKAFRIVPCPSLRGKVARRDGRGVR